MDKKIKYLQLIATFMISLVITIPVYSASVFADLDEINAKGSDGVDNYVKENDYVEFEATASISGDTEITPEQVWMGSKSEFDSCSIGATGYDCKLKYPTNGTLDWNLKAVPYTINLKDDDGNVVDTKSANLYVDNLPPEVTSFNIGPNLSGAGDFKLEYSIEDKACGDSSCSGKCSGINKLELYDNESYKKDIAIDTSDCTFTNESLQESSVFGDGEHTIYAKAYDMLGQISDIVSAKLTVDNTLPVVDSSSFKITGVNGLELDYASTNPVPVTVNIEITEDNLDNGNVIGNFTDINSNYHDLKATCGQTTDSITGCTWQIDLSVSDETAKEFVIEAKDSMGNTASAKMSKSFSVDSTGPVVTSIQTNKVKDNKSYAKLTGNNLTATFTETESGLDFDKVILYVDGVGVKATNCTEGWTCYWDGVDITSGGIVEASIKEDTTDLLGNKVDELFTVDVIVDTDKPKLLNLSVGSIGGSEEELLNYTKTGDKLQIVAILEDESVETAYVDLSSIIQDGNNIEADECTNTDGDNWMCVWQETPEIDISGYIENYIYFYFEDTAGNVEQQQEAITVYGLINEDIVNYWEHELECSPELIDRQTTPLINQKVFCHVKLNPLSGQIVTPLSVELSGCEGDTSALKEFDSFNDATGNKDSYIKLVLNKNTFNVDEINLECSLSIMSLVGDEITQVPEKENVSIKLEFYNMPLGELSEDVEKKIKDAIDDANGGVWKFVTGAKKMIFYAERLCQMLNVGYNIVAVYQLVTNLLGVAEDTNPYAKAIIYPERVGQCIGTESAKTAWDAKENIFDKFCKFVNCQHTFDTEGKYTGLIGKWQEGGDKLMGFAGGDFLETWTGKNTNSYMDPKSSMTVAILTACLPGIVYNLDKWRQIQCMYAHCLKEGVEQQGLPVVACEDQKSYAECKYVTGEIFKVIPFTAFFDYYVGMFKDMLSNPFKIIGAGAALGCANLCPAPTEKPHGLCMGVKIVSLIGQSMGDVTTMIDEGVFTIRDDYCEKLENLEESEGELG